MFGLFKKKKDSSELPQLFDLNNEPLREGDIVEAFRYDLGTCKLSIQEEVYVYESIDSGKQVSWLKMIDASTDFQKVKKIPEQE